MAGTRKRDSSEMPSVLLFVLGSCRGSFGKEGTVVGGRCENHKEIWKGGHKRGRAMWLTSWAGTKDNRHAGNAGHKMSKSNPRKSVVERSEASGRISQGLA